MKPLKGLFLCLVSVLALNAQADTLVLELNLNSSEVYRIDKNSVSGKDAIIKGNFAIRGVLEGQSINFEQAIPATAAQNNIEMIIIDAQTVEVVDRQNGIRGQVRANVKRSMLGRLKSIDIDSDSYLALMRPVLEKSGFDFLSQLNIAGDGYSVSSNVDVSETNCDADGDQLTCESEARITISISDGY